MTKFKKQISNYDALEMMERIFFRNVRKERVRNFHFIVVFEKTF